MGYAAGNGGVEQETIEYGSAFPAPSRPRKVTAPMGTGWDMVPRPAVESVAPMHVETGGNWQGKRGASAYLFSKTPDSVMPEVVTV